MSRQFTGTIVVCALAAACVLADAAPSRAQGFGMRAGANTDPDQFYFGGHYETGPVVERVWFRPNAEVGIGNDVTLFAMNFDLVYRMPLRRRTAWEPYFGGGPAINLVSVYDNTEAQGGFNVLAGLAHRGGLFTEIKIGFMDSPSFKIGVGYSFRPQAPAKPVRKPARRN